MAAPEGKGGGLRMAWALSELVDACLSRAPQGGESMNICRMQGRLEGEIDPVTASPCPPPVACKGLRGLFPHLSPQPLASLLLWEHVRLIPTVGLCHLIFPLLGKLRA